MKSVVALYQQVYYYVWSHQKRKGGGIGRNPEKSATAFAFSMVCFNTVSLCMLIQLFLSAISIIIPLNIMYNGGLLVSVIFSFSIGIFDNKKIVDKCRLLEKEHKLYPKRVVVGSWIASTVTFLSLVLFFLYGRPA